MESLPVLPIHRQVRVPSDARVYGEPRIRLPGVLRIHAAVIAAKIVVIDTILRIRVRFAEHEIAQSQSGVRRGECEGSCGRGIGARVHERVDVVCAKSKLMLPAYPTQGLAKLRGCRVRQSRNVSPLPAEAEPTRDTDAYNPVRQIGRVP